MNVAHQLGSSLGLAVQVAVSVVASGTLTGSALLAHRVDNAMLAAAFMVGLAMLVVGLSVRATDRSRTHATPAGSN